MKVLLVSPRYPVTMWSFDASVALMGKKAGMPPLGLVTVAALLPSEWEFRLRDRNIEEIAEADWHWAEVVMVSGMIVQREDFLAQVRAAKARGKRVAVGGPYATALPDEALAAGADFLVKGEAEPVIAELVVALESGAPGGVFHADEKPDVTLTPTPRFDLLDLNAYNSMSVQFSRGCPFLCEFCDIIVFYGRKPRVKTPAQLLAELQCLYDLGWRGPIFLADDNFIGNRRLIKVMLKALIPWMRERGYPYRLVTQASVDLALDGELMDLMVQAGFYSVFLGIETPDEDSLALTRKGQNIRAPLGDSVDAIARAGLRVLAGFIVGFDRERPGATRRIVEFASQTAISTAMISLLQALPESALWHRLGKEGRLLTDRIDYQNLNLPNFIPTRPMDELAREYVQGYWRLYDPRQFLHRAYRQACLVESAPTRRQRQADIRAFARNARQPIDLAAWRVLARIFWRQGIVHPSRFHFWAYLLRLALRHRHALAGFLVYCVEMEHCLIYRRLLKGQVEAQLRALGTLPEPYAIAP